MRELPVSLGSSFHAILSECPRKHRRTRWEAWKALCRASPHPEASEEWEPQPECSGCAHRSEDWCELAGLPCAVNPITSFRFGSPGFACAGMGFRPRQEVISIHDH